MGYMPHHENGDDSMWFSVDLPLSFYPTDTVFNSPVYTLPATIDSADWVQFTLQKPFLYDPSKNFIVDMAQDSMTGTALNTLKTVSFYAMRRNYTASGTPVFTSNWNNPNIQSSVEVIGFDITPTGVDNINTPVQVSVYPNPAKGKFMISFDAKAKRETARITIMNISGSEVMTESFHDVSGRFLKEFDLGTVPRGVYIVEIIAGGEKIIRKLVLE